MREKAILEASCKWWQWDSEENDQVWLTQKVSDHIRAIRQDQASRYDAYKEWSRAYGADTTPLGYSDHVLDANAVYRGTPYANELANTVDTLHSMVFKNRIVPAACTSDADYEEWLRAKELSRWMEGAWYEAKVHEELVPLCGLDALVHGTGFLVPYGVAEGGEGRVEVERVSALDVFIDNYEARNGNPRNLYQRIFVDRGVLLEKYGQEDDDYQGTAEERIQALEKVDYTDGDIYQDADLRSMLSEGDMICVWKAWHLPSSRKAKDGRQTVFVQTGETGCVLEFRQYKRPKFPHVPLRWGTRQFGFYGESVVKRIYPLQREYNKLVSRISRAHDMLGVPRILVNRSAGLNLDHINDKVGSILMADDTSPNAIREWNATPTTQENYMERDAIPQRMRGLVGVSQFEATAQLPPNFREISGAAMERWQDTSSTRQAMQHRAYESAMVALGEAFIDVAEELQEAGASVAVRSPEGRKVQFLNFEDVNIDRKRCVLRILPISNLSQTFSGRMAELDRLRASGAISMKTYRRMSQVPDLEAENDLDTSDEDIILQNLTFMCEKGGYIRPLPFDNLDLIVQLTTKYINDKRTKGLDDDKVAILSQYIIDAIKLRDGLASGTVSPEAALAGGEPMPPPPPGAPPGMPPVDPLQAGLAAAPVGPAAAPPPPPAAMGGGLTDAPPMPPGAPQV